MAARIAREQLRHEARIAVARAGLDAWIAYRRDGRFPESLATPVDPYTGKPVAYTRTKGGGALVKAAATIPPGMAGDPELAADYEVLWRMQPAK